MTVKLDLGAELEKRLCGMASSAGLDVEEYLRRLIEHALPESSPPRISLQEILTPEEWIRVFHAWIESHDPTLPPLPDQAYSRSGIYENPP